MKHIIALLAFLVFLNFNSIPSTAQCAMCKASVEKSESEAATFNKRAGGLNAGILYLMAIPYLLGGIIVYFWFQSSKKERDRKNEVQRIIRNKLSEVPGGQSL